MLVSAKYTDHSLRRLLPLVVRLVHWMSALELGYFYLTIGQYALARI
jgi:hypothetical protein